MCSGARVGRAYLRGIRYKVRTLQERFEEKYMPEPNSGCWLWTATVDEDGYGKMRIGGRGTPSLRATHVSLMLVGRPVPSRLQACHRCDNPCCVNPDHLFIGTGVDNMRDARAKGRFPSVRGSKNPSSKLTEDCVRAIKNDIASGLQNKAISEKYGITRKHCQSIKYGWTWSHV
jgi:hypothetical protein